MSLLTKIREVWNKPGAKRQAFLILIGVIVLSGVLIFSTQIQNLFNKPEGSKADTRTWQITSVAGGIDRPLGQLVKVTEGSAPYLYAIGGVDFYTRTNYGPSARLRESVQKLALGPDGMPLPGASWQDVAPMNFGHAAFAVHQQDGYLYVISGDMHIPGGLTPTQYPLLYSTIERLNLKQANSTWEVVALLSGVNFYPEVAQTADGMVHIIGGVYGNALKDFLKDKGVSSGGLNSPAAPLDPDGDAIKWDLISNKPVIGGGLTVTGPAQGGTGTGGGPNSTFCDNLRNQLITDVQAGRKTAAAAQLEYANAGCGQFDFNPYTPQGPTTGGLTLLYQRLNQLLSPHQPAVAGETIAQTNEIVIPPIDNPTLSAAEILTRDLQSGSFVTTVGEHFRMRFNAVGTPVTDIQLGELGLDYTGTVDPNPTPVFGRIFQIGPVRLIIRYTTVDYTSNTTQGIAGGHKAIPVPQGRYGHKLLVQGNQIFVIGGASWESNYGFSTTGNATAPYLFSYLNYGYANHWVINDTPQPIDYRMPGRPAELFGSPGPSTPFFGDYHYIGNITYLWNGSSWRATNSTDTNLRLNSSYALKNDDYTAPGGRAFFGWGNNLVSGGLYSTDVATESSGSGPLNNPNPGGPISQTVSTYINHVVTDRTDLFSGTSWSAQPVLKEHNFNPASGTLSTLPSHTSGQLYFPVGVQDAGQLDGQPITVLYDAHVPRTDVPGKTEEEAHSNMTSAFSSDWTLFPEIPGSGVTAFGPSTIVNASTPGVNSGLIYRQDGTTLKVFGPIESGVPGVPYAGNSIFTLSKDTVFADGVDYTTGTITLKDFDGNPVGGANNPTNVHVSLVVNHPTPDWPQDPATINVKFTRGDKGLAPDQPFASFWAKPDANGEIDFKINSQVAQGLTLRAIWANPTEYGTQTQGGSLGPKDLNFMLAATSSIVAVPARVLPDGRTASTVTVTLRDNQGNPIPGYFVRIVSDRNGQNNPVDAIDPAGTAQTDAAGIARFDVTSTTRGYATITGFFNPTNDPGSERPVPGSARIQFAGKIKTLVPNWGEQGIDYPNVTAEGDHTAWKQGTQTSVGFVRPSQIVFRYLAPDGTTQDPATVHFRANRALSHFNVTFSGQPNTQVKIERLSGVGNFWPDSSADAIFVTTNDQATADFYYQAGASNQPGVTKLRATLGDEDQEFRPTKDLWLMYDDSRIDLAGYSLKVMADPVTLDRTHKSAVVRAALYQKVGNSEVLLKPQPPINIAFGNDDTFDTGFVEPATSPTNSQGIATSMYTRGDSNGTSHVYVSAVYQNIVLLGSVSFTKQGDDSGTITFDTPDIQSDTRIVVPNIRISPNAEVGPWMFRVTTTFADGYREITEYPFLVTPSLVARNPIITTVNPNIANRGTSNLSVAITGNEDVNFALGGTPTVVFTPVAAGADASKITVTSPTVSPDGRTVTVSLNIDKNAQAGYWNVKVISGETVEMPGNFDFLVTSPTGYILDLTANPTSIPRDGAATSQLTAKAALVNPWDGSLIPVSTLLTFAKDPARSDAGDALVGANPVTTDAQGVARITFRTDAGTENKDSYVTASYVANGNTITDNAKISKIVTAHQFALAIDKDKLPLRGTPNSVRLTATVTRPDGSKVNGVDVVFETIPGSLDITPNTVRSDAQGVAVSNYIRPNNFSGPSTIQVRAYAIIPGLGKIYSETKTITIGYPETDYTLTFVSDLANIPVNGGPATLTATLTRNNAAVADWPIAFSLTQSALGDRLEIVNATTDAQGKAVVKFFAGATEGTSIIKANPAAMQKFTTTSVIKGAGTGEIDTTLSSVSAVPKFVPANGIATSRITVSLYDSNYRPLAGRAVELTSSRGATDTITPAAAQPTDAYGKALFTIKSQNVGDATLTARIGNVTLTTVVHFVNGADLLSTTLKLYVPLEAKSYDRQIKVIMKRVGATEADIDEVYVSSAADEIDIPTLYLQKNATYKVWAKGRNHLARTRDVVTSDTAATPTRVDFTETHRGTANKGLLIGDVQPEFQQLPEGRKLMPFHDNDINTVDTHDFYTHWFQAFDPIDFNSDGKFNNADFLYWFTNYGDGAAQP